MTKNSTHKRNINNKHFYVFTLLIAIFIAFFSLSFLIIQVVTKQDIMLSIIDEYLLNETDGGFSSLTEERQLELMARASEILNFWSLPVYISGISGMIIFYVFILFGRTKLKYGYFFRTLWTIIFLGASVGIFFTPFNLWMQIVMFFILLSIAIVLIIELVKQDSKRELLKAEIRQEWENKRVHDEQDFIKIDKNKNMKEV